MDALYIYIKSGIQATWWYQGTLDSPVPSAGEGSKYSLKRQQFHLHPNHACQDAQVTTPRQSFCFITPSCKLMTFWKRDVSFPKTCGIPDFWSLKAWGHGRIFPSTAFGSPFPRFPWDALVLEDLGSTAPNAAQHEISMQMTHFNFSVNHHCKCQAHYSQILQGVVTSVAASRERRFLKGAAWMFLTAMPWSVTENVHFFYILGGKNTDKQENLYWRAGFIEQIRHRDAILGLFACCVWCRDVALYVTRDSGILRMF